MDEKHEQTFVFNGKEVFLTGRKAVRKTKRSERVLYEVKQVKYGDSGEAFWATNDELFTVINMKTDEGSEEDV